MGDARADRARPGDAPRGAGPRRGRPDVVAADELLARGDRGGIRWLKPASSLRSRYAYNNVMFVAAGQLLEAVAGRSWDAFVRERLLEPLGMKRTTTTSLAGRGRPRRLAAPQAGRRAAPPSAAPFDNAAAAAGLTRAPATWRAGLGMLVECGNGEAAARRRELPAEARLDPAHVDGPAAACDPRPASRLRGPARELRRLRPRLRPARLPRAARSSATRAGCPATSRA